MATSRILACLVVLVAIQTALSFMVMPRTSPRTARRMAGGPQSTLEGEPAKPIDTSAVDIKGSNTGASSSSISSSDASPKNMAGGEVAGPCPGFPKCDGAYKGKGCVEGKILGGVGAMPGMSWWPIKAYRPCPSASEAGYGYKRRGPDFGEFLAGERRSVTEQKEAAAKTQKRKKRRQEE